MTRFNEDYASLLTKRLVQAQVWAANPRALWVASVLIFKCSSYYKYLFTSIVSMGAEGCLWRPTHQG
jgi:hypothetical protein